MKAIKALLIVVLITLSLSVMGQINDSYIIMTAGGEKITKGEFVNMYQRNNPAPNKTINQKDLDEYLELLINYKLKIKQAKELGLDTTENYRQEISSYRNKLAEPYWNDKEITEELIQEAYNREKEIVRASHILIALPTNWTPQDTLEAYNKALKIRDRLLKGEDFATLAVEFSADPSVKDIERKGQQTLRGNKGDIGYFTSFNMIYPFESACYSMKVGEISMPVRSQRGYHIIKLTDRKPAPFANVTFAHIWINFDSHASQEECKQIIDKAYQELQSGKRFDSVAKEYSDDKYSLQHGGILTGQKVINVPVEYTDMIMATPINQIST